MRWSTHLFALVYAERQAFEHEIVGIAVDNQRGQVVRLGEHEAIAVILRGVEQLLAQASRRGDAPAVKFLPVLLLPADEDAHEDLGEVVDVPLADVPPVVRDDLGERAVFILSLDARDLVGVHPAVPREHTLFLVLF